MNGPGENSNSPSRDVALDHDLGVQGQDENRAGALLAPLVEERECELQAVRSGALHGAVEPLEMSFSPSSNPPIRPITARAVPSFGLDRPFS